MKQDWSKDNIAAALLDLHKAGVPLRATNIQEANSGLHNAIYYQDKEGKNVYFDSLKAAREASAVHAEQQGDIATAEAIRAYNKKQPSPTKFTAQQLGERKQDLVDNLLRKIAAGEDVSYRHQQFHGDRSFVSQCVHAFGKYDRVFAEAGLDYKRFARHIKRGKAAYLEQLIGYASSGGDLDRMSLEAKDPKLASRLNFYFGGYYGALEAAKATLESRGQEADAARIDVEHWRTKAREERRQKREHELASALERIIEIDAEKAYKSDTLSSLELRGEVLGRDIWSSVQHSPQWIQTTELSDRLGCTPSNILHSVVHVFPERTIRYVHGDIVRYAFHTSMVPEYKRRNPQKSPRDSIQHIADKLGVTYSKVRSLIQNIGIKTGRARHKVLTEEHVETLTAVLEREQCLLASIREEIKPQETYTFTELELSGIPIAHFDKQYRERSIPQLKKRGARAVRGDILLPYFMNEYAEGHLSQAIRLMTYFNPHLYASTDLVQMLQMSRSGVLYRLRSLWEENHNACFKFRRSDEKSRIVVNDAGLQFVRQWHSRRGLQFLNVLAGYKERPPINEVASVLEKSRNLITPDGAMDREDTVEACTFLQILRRHHGALLDIGETSLAQRDIALIEQYMRTHSYNALELERAYSLSEVQEMLPDPVLLDGVMQGISRLEFAIASANTGLVRTISGREAIRLRLDSEDAFDAGQEGLMKGLRTFDPSRGKFSTYVGKQIQWEVGKLAQKKRRQREVSLFSPLGEDAELIDAIAAPEQQMQNDGPLGEAISRVLSELPDKERQIVMRHFGFGEKKETLEEIGQSIGLTKERIRQIEKKALERLASDPRLKELAELLED